MTVGYVLIDEVLYSASSDEDGLILLVKMYDSYYDEDSDECENVGDMFINYDSSEHKLYSCDEFMDLYPEYFV